MTQFFMALVLLTFVPAAFPRAPQSALIRAPYSLDFGRILTGRASDSQMVTVFNNGTSAGGVSGISITGDFTETNNCPKPAAVLAANAHCEIEVTFKPSSLGPQSGTLTISEDPSGIQLTVALSGAGAAAEPTVTLSPESLIFPEEDVGSTSPTQAVTVTNTGTEMVSVSNVEANGDFIVLPTSTCAHMTSPLASKASCTIEIAFAPLLTGTRGGAAVITDNAVASPQQVPLSGVGKNGTSN